MAQRISTVVPRTALAFVALALLVIVGIVAAVYVGGDPRDAKVNTLNDLPIDPSALASTGTPDGSASMSGSAQPGPSRGPSPTAGGRRSAAPGSLPVDFPNAGNTGVPAGVVLKPVKGDLVIKRAGTVIDGIDLVGKVVVEADNVTISRSRITAPRNLPNKGRDEFTVIQLYTSAKGLRLEDCEVDGSGLVYRAITALNHLIVNRCELRNVGHGAEVGDNFVIQNSWIHSTTSGPDNDWHIDGIISSIGVNGVIDHNTIVLTGDSLTGAVSIGSSLGPIDNVVIKNNLLAGGNYTVYIQDQGHPATRIQVLDNRFTTMLHSKVGVFGIWYPSQLPGDLVRRGNKVYETGAAADEEPAWG